MGRHDGRAAGRVHSTGRATAGRRRSPRKPAPRRRIPTRASPRPASQCPTIDPAWEDPEGVPISAIIFGGRRATTMPLVYQAFNWSARRLHRAPPWVRRRPRRPPGRSARSAAIRWRCCRSAATTWATTSGTGSRCSARLSETPRIFHVNWFRKDADGKFLWPGFSENMRVLKWIVDRAHGRALGARNADRLDAALRGHRLGRACQLPERAVRRAAGVRPRRLAPGSDRPRGTVHRRCTIICRRR